MNIINFRISISNNLQNYKNFYLKYQTTVNFRIVSKLHLIDPYFLVQQDERKLIYSANNNYFQKV